MTKESSSSSTIPSRKTLIKTGKKKEQVSTPDLASKILIKTEKTEEVCTPELALTTLIKAENLANLLVKSPQNLSISKCEAPKHQASSTSRSCSAPVIHCPKPTVSPVSASQTVPQVSRTLSSIDCLKSEPSLFSQNLEPQSYRNAMMVIRKTGPNLETSSGSSVQSTSFSQPSSSSSVDAGVSFGSVRPEPLHDTRIGGNDKSVASSSHSQGTVPDEFPHLDVINDLLDDDGIVGMATFSGCHLRELYPLNWQQNFLTDVEPLYGPCQLDLPEYYYDDESNHRTHIHAYIFCIKL